MKCPRCGKNLYRQVGKSLFFNDSRLHLTGQDFVAVLRCTGNEGDCDEVITIESKLGELTTYAEDTSDKPIEPTVAPAKPDDTNEQRSPESSPARDDGSDNPGNGQTPKLPERPKRWTKVVKY